MGFPRQEYSSGLPFPSPGDLLDPGIEPVSLTSPALAGGFFTTEPSEKSHICVSSCCYFMPSSAVSISCPVRPSLTSHLSQKPGNQLRCLLFLTSLCLLVFSLKHSHTPPFLFILLLASEVNQLSQFSGTGGFPRIWGSWC